MCPWLRRANQSLRMGSRCNEASSHRPSCSCAGRGEAGAPLPFQALVFSSGTCTVSPPWSARARGWSQVSWAALVLLGETVVLEERAISHRFSSSALILSFTQAPMSAHAPAHIPSLPFSSCVCVFFFFSWQVQKVQLHTQLWSTDSIWESVVGRSNGGGSRVWSLLTRGKAAGRDRHTQRQIPVTQGQELHNYNKVWIKHFFIGHIHLTC